MAPSRSAQWFGCCSCGSESQFPSFTWATISDTVNIRINIQFVQIWFRVKCPHNSGTWICLYGKCARHSLRNSFFMRTYMNNFNPFQCTDGGHFAIWSCFHRIILRIYGHLAESILLPVWLPVLSVLHFGCELWPDIHCDDVFPAVRRGMSLLYALIVVHIDMIMSILQDYRWWWRSFIISGGSAVYILLYSIFYFFTKLSITEFIPTLLYMGYTGKFPTEILGFMF